MNSLRTLVTLASMLSIGELCAAEPPVFTGIAAMPNAPSGIDVVGVSSDGRFVAGTAGTSGSGGRAFRWHDGLFENLGTLPGQTATPKSFAISADGSTIIGWFSSSSGPWIWRGGTMASTPCSPMGNFAVGVSRDGTSWIHRSINNEVMLSSPAGCSPLQPADLSTQVFSILNVSDELDVLAISLAGSWPVSYGLALQDGSLVIPPAGIRSGSQPIVISGDGFLVWGGDQNLWDRRTGSVESVRGLAPPGTAQGGRVISDGGRVLVGKVATGPNQSQASIWTRADRAAQRIECLLRRFGADLTGWTLTEAVGVSGDGKTIVGRGTSPAGVRAGWIARLPIVPLSPDFNQDGFLDFNDFDAIVNEFANGLPSADFNQDGFLDFTDFDDFVTAFEFGC